MEGLRAGDAIEGARSRQRRAQKQRGAERQRGGEHGRCMSARYKGFKGFKGHKWFKGCTGYKGYDWGKGYKGHKGYKGLFKEIYRKPTYLLTSWLSVKPVLGTWKLHKNLAFPARPSHRLCTSTASSLCSSKRPCQRGGIAGDGALCWYPDMF